MSPTPHTSSAERARVPGTTGPGTPQRRPFGGKNALVNLVPVRFERSFQSELFDAGELFLVRGEQVVVDTSKGLALGTVSGLVERKVVERGRVHRIVRRATEADRERTEANKLEARAAFKAGIQRIKARRLDMKLCQVEYTLDGSRVLFYFSAEKRVDFRQLVRDLARDLNVRIEMRQVGVRDGAGLIGGIGPCGKELCCASFLTDFRSISIRHAKDQGLTLNPKKVSGMCGRLMCCLVYEHTHYRAAKKGAPRVNRAVETAAGPGTISEVDLLQRRVRVYLESGSFEEFPFSEIIVDDDTVRKARDLAKAAPSRPRASERAVKNASSRLDERYSWDDAEAAELLALDEGGEDDDDGDDDDGARGAEAGSDGSGDQRGRKRRRGRGRGRTASGVRSAAPGEAGDAPPTPENASAGEGTSEAATGEGAADGERRAPRSRGRGRDRDREGSRDRASQRSGGRERGRSGRAPTSDAGTSATGPGEGGEAPPHREPRDGDATGAEAATGDAPAARKRRRRRRGGSGRRRGEGGGEGPSGGADGGSAEG